MGENLIKNIEKYGHWEVPHDFDPEDFLGFVYLITNNVENKKYIGQKLLWNKVTKPPKKGKVNKRRSKKESNWKEYTGSSKQLNEDIEKLGKDNFTFEILELYETKWEITYGEYSRIIKEDAIPKKSYYNDFLGRVGKCPNKLKY